MVNKRSPGCECTCGENGCDYTVTEITLDSSDACLAAFIGTWATSGIGRPDLDCDFDCREGASSFLPGFHPDANCTVSSTTYTADFISMDCLRFNDSTTVWVRIQLIWRVGGSDVQLVGRFQSTDNGNTFGSFEIDTWPPGCILSGSSDGPTTGSDLTCTITKV